MTEKGMRKDKDKIKKKKKTDSWKAAASGQEYIQQVWDLVETSLKDDSDKMPNVSKCFKGKAYTLSNSLRIN